MSNLPGSATQTHDTGTHEAGGFGRHGKGTLLRTVDGPQGPLVAFQPVDTSYEHHLVATSTSSLTLGRFVRGTIRVRGRKVYSVAGGGNFVQPILGTPRIIQGRVLGLEGGTLYVKAGAVFAIELPTGPDTIDSAAGAVAVGSMVNVVAWPGAAWEGAPGR